MTDQDTTETTPGVGALLRASRLRYGLEIDEVARTLRIRRRFIEAIEEGRLDQLPGASYTMGFVKTYAEHLGLDGEEVVRRCRAESIAVDKKTSLSFPTPLVESSMPSGSIVVAGALVAMVSYGSWYTITTQEGVIAELISPLPERFSAFAPSPEAPAEPASAQARTKHTSDAATASAAATPPQAEVKTEAALAPVLVPPPPARPNFVPPATPAAAAPSTSTTPASAPTVTPSPAAPTTARPLARNPAVEFGGAAGTAPATQAPIQTAADPNSRITVRATLPSWIQVRDEAGNEFLVTRLLRAGDSLSIPDRPGLRLLTGNAGALEILVDGRVVPSIGPAGAVRRDVILDAERLNAGTARRANSRTVPARPLTGPRGPGK
ncbi:MAG: helix-turn-helix domain-containing protein [Rhodospirillales bacterium]|nr:helix-turn-helix domain-containing protein [Rhodospirillales bacterium]